MQREDVYLDREPGLQVRPTCEIDKWATITIEAYREDLKDVQCVSLNDGMFKDSTMLLGDISKGSQDICAFEANELIDAPPRFEIRYNDGKISKTVCNRGWILD